MADTEKKAQHVSIDRLLAIVGEYGRFQKVVNGMFCIMAIPCIWHAMIIYFTADYPAWTCVQEPTRGGDNSTVPKTCIFNGTFDGTDRRRCDMHRSEWKYTEPIENSLLAYYDVDCKSEWLIEMVTSIFFVGWIFGAFALGWICDNIGRKIVLLVSMVMVISVAFASIFMPSIYLFIVCRFFIGFFLPGTMPEMFIIMTEIVGRKYRSFAGLLVFEFGVVSSAILGLKAYFIRNWKTLHIVCTVPYVLVFVFFKFIPESIRYLRVKGRNEELMILFRRISKFNNRAIPDNVYIEPVSSDSCSKKTNPLDLFRTRSLAARTLIEIFGFFASGLLYYGVYLAANDLGGYKYRDYTIITVSELPVVFLSIYLCERYGRRRTCIFPVLLACAALLGLAFIPRQGNMKIFRVVFGMFGKCLMGSNMDILHTWATELYPTNVRGEAIGIFQAALRLGAATAPWIDQEFTKIHKSASFLFMAGIALASFVLLGLLPETKSSGMIDTGEEVVGVKSGHDVQGSGNNELRVMSYVNGEVESGE